MKLSDKDVEEFQELYKQHYGVEISKQDAYERASRLVRLMEVLSKNEAERKNSENKSFEK